MSGQAGVDEAFWAQVRGDAKRTVLCEPHRLVEIAALMEARGYDHVTVLASPACPSGRLLVLDEGGMEAAFRQAVQRSALSLYRH